MSENRMQPKPIYSTNELNLSTQPLVTHPVFANWDIIAKGWYFVGASASIPVGKIKSFDIHGQKVVVYRGEDGKLKAVDAFCPHMGADLSIGTVQGNHIRCFFHHWKFNGDGQCVDIPCLTAAKEPRPSIKIKSYAVVEKFQCVWIWPDASPDNELVDYPVPLGDDPVAWFGKPILRTCHHHVCMINGLDPQHLKTVHKIGIKMDLTTNISSDGQVVDFVLTGEFPDSVAGRISRFLFGPKYSYGMRYVNASVGLLTTMRGLRFRGKGFAWPESHMIFAYLPLQEGQTLVQPIFINRKRPGLLGWLVTRAMLSVAYLGFYALRDEDGAVYDNIRFQPKNLLPLDAPILQFINYVNRLKVSLWSRHSGSN